MDIEHNSQGLKIQQKPPGNFILRFLKELWYHFRPFFYCFFLFLVEVFQERKKLKVLPDRKGEVAVITGGSRGFGFEAVKSLLECGFTVIVGDVHKRELHTLTDKDGSPHPKLKYIYLNLKSFKSIREFAKHVLNNSSRIDLLLNNAGIMFTPYEETEDGFESQFQVNYLGHVLLTELLLPIIKKTAQTKNNCCRIVHTSSVAHFYGSLNFENPESCNVYAANKSYMDSKYAQVMYTKYLDRLLQKENAQIRVNCLHPGITPSQLWDHVYSPFHKLFTSFLFKHFYRTTADGGNVIIYAALSPDLETKGGLYLENCDIKPPHSDSENVVLQQKLHDKSLELIKKENELLESIQIQQ